MFNIRKRLGASILLTVSSLISLISLLPDSKVKQLQRVTLGTTIEYTNIWRWGVVDEEWVEEEDNGNGIRLVIFGDSWVDDLVKEGQKGKMRNWPAVLCEEINCTSRLNFAASQPTNAWPASPPTGAMTSNEIHAWALDQNKFLRGSINYTEYPDLATQIQNFMSLPAPKVQPQQTIFIVSFGLWDIYDSAQLDLESAQNVTDTCVDSIFDQLDILYSHFSTKLYPDAPLQQSNLNFTEEETQPTSTHKFQVIIPRIFDPTLTPGWMTHRPLPPKPSNVAEQQRNAVYLTERWNQAIENNVGAWMERVVIPPSLASTAASSSAVPSPSLEPKQVSPELELARSYKRDDRDVLNKFRQYGETAGESANEPSEEEKKKVQEEAKALKAKEEAERKKTAEERKAAEKAAKETEEQAKKEALELAEALHLPKKDVFYHDASSLLLDLILEHQMEDEGISDASGLGKQESPFESVYVPCMRPLDLLEQEEAGIWMEREGMAICNQPEAFLWWDAWNLGQRGKELVGHSVAELILEGKSLRFKMENRGH